MSAIVLSGGKVLSIGGGAIIGSSPAPPPASGVKWAPGVAAMTANINSNTSGELIEINCLAASLAANPTLSSIVFEYSIWRFWNDIQPTTQGIYNFSSIDTTWNNLQAAIPGCHFSVSLNPYRNFRKVFNNNAGTDLLPTYILNSATYGNSNQGGISHGWGLVNYQTGDSTYNYLVARLDNVNVLTEWVATRTAMGNHIMPNIPGLPQYNGLPYNLHPLCGAVLDQLPSENSGGYQNSPTTPTDYTAAKMLTSWRNRPTLLQAAAPNTLHGLMLGFEWSGGSVSDLNTALSSIVSADGGAGFSTTDCTTFVATAGVNYSDGAHYDVGDTYNGTSWTTGGGTDRRDTIWQGPCVQTPDYLRGPTHPQATQEQALLCIQSCGYAGYGAHNLYVAMADNSNFNVHYAWFNNTGSPQTFAGAAYSVAPGQNGYIVNALLQAGPNPNTTRPSNLV